MGVRLSVGRRPSVWKWWEQGAGDTAKFDNWPLAPLHLYSDVLAPCPPPRSELATRPPRKKYCNVAPELCQKTRGDGAELQCAPPYFDHRSFKYTFRIQIYATIVAQSIRN